MAKKKGNLRLVDIQEHEIPKNCNRIVITQNKTRIVINNNTRVTTSVANKQDLIMKKVKVFFDKEENFALLRPVLMQESDLSLRLLDWTTTNWSRKKSITLQTSRNGYPETINMFLDYKAHLKAFSKRSFDPFCRRERIMLTCACDPERKIFVTTPAQLNFMKWAIESGVMHYCRENLHEIEADMVSSLKVKRKVHKKSIATLVTSTPGPFTVGLE